MTFEGRPINALGQIELEIFNEGSEPIKEPTFFLKLSDKSVVLDVLVTPQDIKMQTSRSSIAVTLPYLNPVSEHGQIVKLSLLADGETEDFAVSGGGEGWSVRLVRLSQFPKSEFYWALTGIISVLLMLPLVAPYGKYIEKTYRIPADEVSLRSLVAFLPFIGLIIIIGIVPVLNSIRLSLRRFKESL